MNRTNLLDELKRRPLLCDGAMGTQLMAAGLASGACGELWNVKRPADVRAIHERYRAAGCDLVTTNTFGGTSASLERHGCASQVAELNSAGASVARQAAGDSGWVLGDVGPFGGFLEPVGDAQPNDVLAMFVAQVEALLQGGSDAIIIETMSDPAEMQLAIRAARHVNSKVPVIATYAFGRSDGVFRTMMGTSAADAIKAALDAGADVVGANCGTGLSLDDYVALAAELVKSAGKAPVILQPNAGAPHNEGGKTVYKATPEQMAAIVAPLLKAGVRIVGGCCGTAPPHLKAMGQALRAGAKR